MSIYTLMENSPNNYFYSTKEKLNEYVENRVLNKIRFANEKRALIDTPEKHKEYAEKMRADFIENLGYLPYDNSLPLNAKTVGVIEEGDLTIEKVIFESRPNVYVTSNVYVPKKRSEKSAAILFVLGHSRNGKFYDSYQKVARRIAKQGFIVLTFDPTGQGERLNYPEKNLANPMVGAAAVDHTYFGVQCLLTGYSPAGYFLADAMRAIDYLESREDVDSDRIGVTGNSGGGTLTSHLMICDRRVKAAAPGTFITTREENIKTHTAQDTEQIWLNSLCYGFDFYDIFTCFAPKPCMLLGVEYDFFPIEGAEEVISKTKHFWEMYGSDELHYVCDKSVHSYTAVLADSAAKFFGRLFDTNYDNNIACDIVLPEKDLRCTESGQVVLDFDNALSVYDENKKVYDKTCGSKADELVDFLKSKMYFERDEINLHLKYYQDAEYEHGLKYTPLLWFSQKALPNFAYLISDFKTEKINSVCIVLTDNGTLDLERNIYKIRKLLKKYDGVLVADLSGMGQSETQDRKGGNPRGLFGYFYTINMNMLLGGDSIAALHLFELDTMVNMLKEYYTENISLYAEGRMANISELYSYVNPDVKVTLGEYEKYAEIVENKYYEGSNIAKILLPGITKYLK